MWGSRRGDVGSSQPWVPAPAERAAASRRCRQQRLSQHPAALPEAASTLLVLLDAAVAPAYVDPALAADTFEPQLRPEIVVAAACAAAPPIIFWARIFASQMRRVRAIEQEKAAEDQRAEERAVRRWAGAGPGAEGCPRPELDSACRLLLAVPRCPCKPGARFARLEYLVPHAVQILKRKITGQDSPPASSSSPGEQ